MKIERELFKISIKEIVWFFLVQFAVINTFTFTYSVIKGNPSFLMYDFGILYQVFIPLVNAVMFGMGNRKGTLKISAFADKSIVKDQIESLLKMNAYSKEKISEGHDIYSNTSKRNKILDYFFRQTLEVKYEDDLIMLLAKRNLLKTIKMKLEFGKQLSFTNK